MKTSSLFPPGFIHLAAYAMLALGWTFGFPGAARVSAQTVPPLMNYQGRLSNPDGSPLASGDYQLTFKIYDSSTNSTGQLWGPQIFDGQAAQGHGPMVPVVQGYFNVMLGPVDTNNSPLANAFLSTNCYVEITVGSNSPISPRQQILTVPFAFQAANAASASSVGGLPATSIASAAAAANAATNANIPNSIVARDSSGSFSAGSITATNFNGPGAGLTSLNASQVTTGNLPAAQLPTGLSMANGGLGVGMNPGQFPSYKLDVQAAANSADGGRFFANNAGWIGLFPSLLAGNYNALTQAGDEALIFSSGSAPNGNLVIGVWGAGTGMRIQANGNVGIGTASPQANLSVQGGMNVDQANANNGTGPDLTFGSGAGEGIGSKRTSGADQYGLDFYTSNKVAMSITEAGKVGIGTTAPTNALMVVGDIDATVNVYASGVLLTSDRNAKTNFQSIPQADALAKVVSLPISRWEFTNSVGVRHLGPMAQDFRAAFGLGEDDKHISAGDEIGVALAAIQGLQTNLDEMRARLRERDAQLRELRKRLWALETASEAVADEKPEGTKK